MTNYIFARIKTKFQLYSKLYRVTKHVSTSRSPFPFFFFLLLLLFSEVDRTDNRGHGPVPFLAHFMREHALKTVENVQSRKSSLSLHVRKFGSVSHAPFLPLRHIHHHEYPCFSTRGRERREPSFFTTIFATFSLFRWRLEKVFSFRARAVVVRRNFWRIKSVDELEILILFDR